MTVEVKFQGTVKCYDMVYAPKETDAKKALEVQIKDSLYDDDNVDIEILSITIGANDDGKHATP